MLNYTKEEYKKACTELLEILKHVPISSLNKIPKETIEMYKLNRHQSYKYYYDEALELEEQKISHLTQILIANLYIEYWASEEERKKIKEKDKQEIEKIEKQKRELYSPNEIFENKKRSKNQETVELTVTKKKNILEKLIEKIRKFSLK